MTLQQARSVVLGAVPNKPPPTYAPRPPQTLASTRTLGDVAGNTGPNVMPQAAPQHTYTPISENTVIDETGARWTVGPDGSLTPESSGGIPDISPDNTAQAPPADNNAYGAPIDILDPTGRYVTHFYAPTKYHGAYGYVEDRSTGGTRPMSVDEIATFSGGGAGGGTGADHYATDVSAGTAAAARAEQAREFNLTHGLAEQNFGENVRQTDQGILNQRAGAGLSVAELGRSLANDAYARAKDPGNFPAYLAAQAGVPGGTPALTALLGKDYQIEQAPGSNPLADPRYQQLYSSLQDYGTVPNPAAVDTIRASRNALGDEKTRELYGNLAAFDAARTAAQPPPAGAPVKLAAGGSYTTSGPTALENLSTGNVNAIAGEGNGPEQVTVTPLTGTSAPTGLAALRAGTTGSGGVQTVQDIAAANNGTLPQSFYDYTGTTNPAAGKSYTEATATSAALAKALGPLGYAPTEVMQTLERGGALTPNMVAGKFGDRLQKENPGLWEMVKGAVQARVGSAGLGDWLGQATRYEQPGFASAGGVMR